MMIKLFRSAAKKHMKIFLLCELLQWCSFSLFFRFKSETLSISNRDLLHTELRLLWQQNGNLCQVLASKTFCRRIMRQSKLLIYLLFFIISMTERKVKEYQKKCYFRFYSIYLYWVDCCLQFHLIKSNAKKALMCTIKIKSNYVVYLFFFQMAFRFSTIFSMASTNNTTGDTSGSNSASMSPVVEQKRKVSILTDAPQLLGGGYDNPAFDGIRKENLLVNTFILINLESCTNNLIFFYRSADRSIGFRSGEKEEHFTKSTYTWTTTTSTSTSSSCGANRTTTNTCKFWYVFH